MYTTVHKMVFWCNIFIYDVNICTYAHISDTLTRENTQVLDVCFAKAKFYRISYLLLQNLNMEFL